MKTSEIETSVYKVSSDGDAEFISSHMCCLPVQVAADNIGNLLSFERRQQGPPGFLGFALQGYGVPAGDAAFLVQLVLWGADDVDHVRFCFSSALPCRGRRLAGMETFFIVVLAFLAVCVLIVVVDFLFMLFKVARVIVQERLIERLLARFFKNLVNR